MNRLELAKTELAKVKAELAEIRAEPPQLDGRFYDLSEAGNTLTAQLRRGVAWHRRGVSLLIFIGVVAVWSAIYCGIWFFFPGLPRDPAGGFLLQVLMLPVPFLGMFLWVICLRDTLIVDRGRAKVIRNGRDIGDLSRIASVRAWRRGRRFYIGFHLPKRYEKGVTIRLGRFGYGRSEYAWRRDAAQIAAFLEVPLEIPPL